MLYLLLIAPVLAAVLTCFSGGKDGDASSRMGLALSLLIAAMGLPLIIPGLLPAAWTAPVSAGWFTLWGTGAQIHLSLASDGLTAWLAQLVTWLTPVAILGCRRQVGTRVREFVACVLALEALMLGALFARDLVVFYLCYEGMLIPMVVIIALFGGIERRAAALWFFLYTMLGSVFMLVAIWYLAFTLHTTDLAAVIAGATKIQPHIRGLLFWGFVAAFAVKVPLVPLHAWQPRTYAETPGAGVALLAGAMAKIGIYGFLRFILPIFPDESAGYAHYFVAAGIIGTLGGGLVAIVQEDAKRMLAYSSLSHLGLVMIGIFSLTPSGLNGAAMQMVAHGFSVAALFLLVGYLEARTQSVGVDDFGGLANRTPVLATLFVIAALASAALPGTANFIGEFQILLGTFRGLGFWCTVLAGIPVVLVVVYMLVLIQRWFYGEAHGQAQHGEAITDLTTAEGVAVAVLLLLSFFFGFYPSPITTQAGACAETLGQPAADCAAALHQAKAASASAVPVPALALLPQATGH